MENEQPTPQQVLTSTAVSRSQSLPALASHQLSQTMTHAPAHQSPSPRSQHRKKHRKRKRPTSPSHATNSKDDQCVPQKSDTSHAKSTSPSRASPSIKVAPSISFWDYLRDELTVSDFDSAQELKRERVTNFLAVPGVLEKLMAFGWVVCLDSFLYTFTILPLRFCLALYHYVLYATDKLKMLFFRDGMVARLRSSQKCDLLKGLLIIITCILMSYLDPSRLYHSIRGQAVLKLYIVFNVLEVCDKLCCSVGADILDALFSKSALGKPEGSLGGAYTKRQLRPFTLFFMATGYMAIHTAILFFQMITLNVAINFYSNALLSLLISNQFVEIKQAVFKKFEKENLFQLSCSDIVERFQQSVFLAIITLRNVVELSESSPSSVLPSTFVPLFFKLPATTWLNALMTPVVMIVASELMVDWLKHAFITKFNQIRPSIYEKYIDILCKDLIVGSPGRLNGKKDAFIDQSPVVSRRIGFPSLPLACLHIRMMQQLLPMIFMSQHGQTGNTTALATMFTFGLLNCLSNSESLISRILPARIHQVTMAMVQSGWVERALDKFIRCVMWTLLVSALALTLLALKILVGTTLLGYAYKRYTSMESRDEAAKEKDKELKALGKDEEEYRAGVRSYLNDKADNILGQETVKYTLENVDRFSMVRSRIP